MKTLSESDQTKQLLAEDAVSQLNVALKSLQLYPPEHVVSRQATEGLLSKLRAYFAANGRLDLGIDKDMISLDGSPLATGNRAFIALARDLFQLKLEAILFGPGVDARQIEALLSVLCMDPEEVEAAGQSNCFGTSGPTTSQSRRRPRNKSTRLRRAPMSS